MSQKICILCPGQGAQVVGMGKDFVEASDAARAVFDRANSILGFDLGAICFGGPEERLNQTDISQPAIYVTSVAAYEAARSRGIIDDADVAILAGLSLGEYTALHLAGAMSFEDGLRLVAARGRYMQESAVAVPLSALQTIGSTHKVLVVREGRIEERLVEVGETKGDAVEIRRGVLKGDVVVIGPGAGAVDGVKVVAVAQP